MVSIDEAIYFLNKCRVIHEYFVYFPEFCNKQVGDVKHHKRYVSEYNQVIELLEALKAGKSK